MINIYKGNLTSKQRVLKTFNHEKTDRVPIDYLSNPTVHKRLAKYLGIRDDMDTVCDALGVDFKELMPKYIGKKLFDDIKNRQTDPIWGSRTQWVKNDSGGYWDYCDFPLRNKDDEFIASWPLPNPDDFDYDDLLQRCRYYKDKAVYLGNPGLCDIMNSFGMLRGMEDTYIDMILETEGSMIYIDRRLQVQLGIIERALDKCKNYVDFIWIGEDLGTQHAPLISLNVFHKQIRPRHQKMVDLASQYSKPVMIHCCGSSSWAFDDFIEMGIKAVDTLQPEAANMSPEYLAKRYGNKLMFHGCISTAKLAVMTEQQVRQNVKEVLDIMRPYNCYCLAPTHLIQDNTPVENIAAMYETGHSL